jgi:hypothetical protein
VPDELPSHPAPGRTDAGVALVRADTALRDGLDELSYAVAQFGEDRTRDFKAALDAAKADLDKAFRYQQRLDDAEPGQRSAATRVDPRDQGAGAPGVDDGVRPRTARFEALRRSEADAPETIRLLRRNWPPPATAREERATFADLEKAYTDDTSPCRRATSMRRCRP